MSSIVEKHRGILPHLQLEEQIISVTWRLAFTLPKPLLELQVSLSKEFEELCGLSNPCDRNKLECYKRKIEEFDKYLGKYDLEDISLCDYGIGEIIEEALRFYGESLYELHCYCIMPNHIHLMIRPLPNKAGCYIQTSIIVQRLKTYTAKQINIHQGKQGKVWQRDYFDRYIRDPADYYNVVNYILNNPVKAGLMMTKDNWRYSYYCPGLI